MSFLTGKKLSSCHSVNLPNGFRSSIGRHVSGEVRSLERDSKIFGNNCATVGNRVDKGHLKFVQKGT